MTRLAASNMPTGINRANMRYKNIVRGCPLQSRRRLYRQGFLDRFNRPIVMVVGWKIIKRTHGHCTQKSEKYGARHWMILSFLTAWDSNIYYESEDGSAGKTNRDAASVFYYLPKILSRIRIRKCFTLRKCPSDILSTTIKRPPRKALLISGYYPKLDPTDRPLKWSSANSNTARNISSAFTKNHSEYEWFLVCPLSAWKPSRDWSCRCPLRAWFYDNPHCWNVKRYLMIF